MSERFVVVGLGEILWDLLPDGKKLGGAPANFAHSVALLGDESTITSRIGADELGNEIVAKLSEVALSSDNLQRDPKYPTGTVKVRLDDQGQASYAIVESVAWDFLEWTSDWHDLARRADAVCFGSLAQRSSQSRSTVRNFLNAMRPETVRVFDVNLRQSFYSAELLRESMKLANIAKLNHDELPVVANMLGIRGEKETTAAQALCQACELNLVCVTRGAHGSLLVSPSKSEQHPGFKVEVADTVGAGDAFTAGLIHEYLRGASFAKINDTANRMGAWVSTQIGGMPNPAGNLQRILGSFA